MTAVVTASLLMFRTSFNRQLNALYDVYGMFDLLYPESVEKKISEIMKRYPDVERAELYTVGNVEVFGQEFVVGYLNDETAARLMHLPLESGRLPENEGEVAVSRPALTKMYWAGTLGESIMLGGEEYLVTGILSEDYCNRFGTDLSFREEVPNRLPSVYISKPAVTPEDAYKFTVIDGLFTENIEANDKLEEELFDAAHSGIDMDDEFTEVDESIWIACDQEARFAEFVKSGSEFRLDVKFLLMLSGMASAIAVLSVFSILKSVFAERSDNIRMLRRIGMSAQAVRLMYAVECAFFIVIQTALGLGLGIAGYSAVYSYQVNVLDKSDHSAFTTDLYVLENTLNPFFIAILFSIVIMILSYILTGITSRYKPRTKISKAKAGGLFANFGAIFRQRGITVIQTLALSIICFGSLLGFIYYDNTNKGISHGLPPYSEYMEDYSVSEGFDMEEDGIEEYYSCTFQNTQGLVSDDGTIGDFILAEESFSRGISDDDVERYDSVMATGKLSATYITPENDDGRWKIPRSTPPPIMLEGIAYYSDEEYKNFFTDGFGAQRYLYNVRTNLADARTVEKMSEAVVDGEIDIRKLNSGEEVLLVISGMRSPVPAGEEIELASICGRDIFAISGYTSHTARIGAVVDANLLSSDKLLQYAAKNSEKKFNLLTTADSANACGFYSAAYTELFAFEDIDGGTLPASSEMSLISLKEVKRRAFIDKAMRYGGVIMIVVLMSLLGFAGYFSGIGLKIRARSYEIATLRGIGSKNSSIKRRLILDNLKIPMISSAIGGVGVFAVQRVMQAAYDKWKVLHEMAISLDFSAFPSLEEFAAAQNKLFDEGNVIIERFCLEKQMWAVPTLVPMIILFTALCAVTFILTSSAMRKYKGSISEIMNAERRRQ